MSQRVLLVEDDHAIRMLLRLLLEDHGYVVREAVDGPSALRVLEQEVVDLVLLDLRLPGMSGFDVLREVRKTNRVPIVIVSAQQDTHDVVAGLELGADDYVTKPFHERELLARIRVQLRSTQPIPVERFVFGDVEVREAEGRVLKSGTDLTLTRTEFRLLCYLATHEGHVLSRAQLLEAVWDYPSDGDGRLVDTHIARLRAKIETPATDPPHLVTVRGLGYKLMR